MADAIYERIRRVVSEVFAVSIDEVDEDSSPDTIVSWDSLAHLNLVLALENEFGLSLSPEDAMEMLSVRLIHIILNERGASDTAAISTV